MIAGSAVRRRAILESGRPNGMIALAGSALAAFWAVVVATVLSPAVLGADEPPNVLFIAVDDWNDWNSVLEGHPRVHTPNLNRLAARSAVFTRAYCSSPVCNPSRTAVMFGRPASSTGVYNNEQFMRDSPVLRDADTIPQHFRRHGYRTITAGKIFHWYKNEASDPQSWDEQFEYDFWAPRTPRPKYEPFAAGPLDVPDGQMPDMKVARWIADRLAASDDQPFFMAAGIFRPHLPWRVPQKYFKLYPLNEIQLPEAKADDWEDLPPRGREIAGWHNPHNESVRLGTWKRGVQAYLASISFADACLGVMLDALEASPHADNTIVILWSDHGYHLGEKLTWHKWKLWEESIRVNLMCAVPGLTDDGFRINQVVSLLDIYPTLNELAGLPTKPELEGESFAPLMRHPDQARDRAVVIHRDYRQYAVRNARFNYIRYEDGSDELYDHRRDPMEWTNLSKDSVYESVKEDLSKYLPATNHPPIREDFDSRM